MNSNLERSRQPSPPTTATHLIQKNKRLYCLRLAHCFTNGCGLAVDEEVRHFFLKRPFLSLFFGY